MLSLPPGYVQREAEQPYVDFTQTTDAEVKQLLDEARGAERPVETT